MPGFIPGRFSAEVAHEEFRAVQPERLFNPSSFHDNLMPLSPEHGITPIDFPRAAISLAGLSFGATVAEPSTLQLEQLQVPGTSRPDGVQVPCQDGTSTPKWYAVFTLSNHEKRAMERCTLRQVESFLPLYKTRRKWKNRCTVDLELPLFPNYFFVRIVPRDRVQVLQLPGVIAIVASRGQLLPLADEYITALRDGLRVHKIEPHSDVAPGKLVRITTGPLAGTEGILERHKNGFRVLLKLEMLARSISVEVGANEVELCGTRSRSDCTEMVRYSRLQTA